MSSFSRPFRVVATLLIPAQFGVTVPEVFASSASTAPPAAPTISVNRTVPKVEPVPSAPEFSILATDREISQARVFSEPLIPMSGPRRIRENRALAGALASYAESGNLESLEPLLDFLQAYPNSRWRVALLANIGFTYRHTGYFTRALAAWEEAWRLGKNEKEPRAKAIVDGVVSQLAELNARLGRREHLDALVAEIRDRKVGGAAGERLETLKLGRWRMDNDTGLAFRCGPYALESIHRALSAGSELPGVLLNARSTERGTSLLQMDELARRAGLELQMAYRTAPDADIPAPALVHWKSDHFAAIVEEHAGRYRIQDPTFGTDLWVSQAALNDESSGHFLISGPNLPDGWRAVTSDQAAKIWGKGIVHATEDPHVEEPKTPKNCPVRMAQYSISLLNVGLHVYDTPVGYTPPRGPDVQFEVDYNQNDVFQPQVFTYSNLGPRWTFTWLSYVADNASNPAANVTFYGRGGGQATYTGLADGQSDIDRRNQSVLVRTSTSPIRYERRLPDGSVEVFDSAPTGYMPRKIFLSRIVDPQGNAVSLTYDSSLRLVAITDAIGQVTSLAYENSDPLKITKVTDPFGRFATFEYDAQGRLQKITDVIGIASEFTYSGADVITELKTPYGVTRFASGGQGLSRWIEVTDPLGGQERAEFSQREGTVSKVDPSHLVPVGMGDLFNDYLHGRNTFYWDKLAMARAPGDYTKAHIYHWLHRFADSTTAIGVLDSEKKPLENRVWYTYPGQARAHEGTSNKPSAIGRVLDDGTTQLYMYEYNAKGYVTKEIDPVGRETVFEYDTNEIDLLRKKQKNGAGYDLLETMTYNSHHQPLTLTDAAGQTTTYTYNADGTPATTVLPAYGGLSIADRTTSFAYYSSNAPLGAGRVQSITQPLGAITRFTYDSHGRIRTETDTDNQTRTYEYDALDRPTKITYDDGTFEERVYQRLDVERLRDREGRWLHYFHDALRRLVSTRDALARQTTRVWCTCGSLDKVTDANGNTITWERDLQGRVRRETRADTTYWQYTYENARSRVKEITDPKGQTRNFQYFADGKLKEVSYTNVGHATPTVSFTYDPAYPRLTSTVDATGTTTYAYNGIGVPGAALLSSEDGPGAADTITYGYDELSRRVSRTIDGLTTTWGLDALGRASTVTHPVGTFVYGYAGVTRRRTSLSYPNGTSATYAYVTGSSDHRLEEIHHRFPGGATLAKFNLTYSPTGDITSWRQQDEANPATMYDFGYDAVDQLIAATYRTTDPSPTILKRYRWAYDPVGNRTANQVDDAPQQGTYNNMNRLLSEQPAGALLFAGSTNEPATVTVQSKPSSTTADNRFSGSAQVGAGMSTVTVTAADAANNVRTNNYQVSVSGPAKSYTYDANGNMTRKVDGDTWDYEWYADDRLAKVKKNGVEVARFIYDGFGRRYQKIAGGSTTTYTYDAEDIMRETVGSAVFHYVHGGGTDEPLARRDQAGGVVFYHVDHLGSVVKTTDSTGAVVSTRRYDPYGALAAGATEVGYAFNGREWDPDAGLYFYRERWYDPTLGRFLSEDPIGLVAGPNFYLYVQGSPVNKKDPSGLTSEDFWKCLLNPWTCSTSTAPCYVQAEGLELILAKGSHGGSNDDNNRNNAIKHCTWACCIAVNSGWKKAIEITDAHESDDRNRPAWACNSQMDRWNNRIGAGIGERTRWSWSTCKENCSKSDQLMCSPRDVPPEVCSGGGF